MIAVFALIHIIYFLECFIGCKEKKIDALHVTIFFLSLAAIILGYIYINKQEKIPTAIDVYRGKTTLEITYRDSVAIDSLVVFK